MRILLVDTEALGLDFALRCAAAGHDVRWFRWSKKPLRDGEGFKGITIVDDWKPHMAWAKDGLIWTSGNFKFLHDFDRYRSDFGYKIFAPTVASANLEINRSAGMDSMKAAGMELPPYQMFNSMKDAEAFARKSERAWVFKPMGDTDDKSLTYVGKDPADMVGWIQRQIARGATLKGPCMLQEKIDMACEFGVSGWFGPDGFLPERWQICFEHKPLMNGDIGPNCFTPDAEVLTQEGWKFWPDVTGKDEICTLVDGRIEYATPSKMVCEDFDGDLVGWESPTTDILVTPGHNMYVQDDHYRKPFWFEPAIKSFGKTRTIMRTGGAWAGEEVNLPACARSGVEKWAALLGAYIADGNCKSRSVVFGNCPPHKVAEFTAIAAAAGFDANLYGIDLYINSADLAAYMRDFGNAAEKFVPQYIKDSKPEVIAAFLLGYGLGDGTRRPDNLTYSTVSQRLADDLQELCLKVGYAASVATRDRRNESHLLNGVLCVNRLISYEVRVSLKKQKAEISPDIGYRQKYRGKVYCVTVPSHVIFTRRNGKACWIGQTGEQGTVCQYVEAEKLADECLKPMAPALAALGHRGDFAVGVGIDKKGKAWPFEFTVRCGWPAFYIQVASHRGDPAQWMRDLLDGKDTLRVSNDVAIGVVMAQPRYPYNASTPEMVEGNPITGLDSVWRQVHPACVMMGKGPMMEDGKVVEGLGHQTTGEYVLVTSGLGKTVAQAQKKVYGAIKKIHFPNKMYRTDIGDKVIKSLPELHSFGYALEMEGE